MVVLKQFQKFWNESKKNIFRLEVLPEYKIKGDLESFNKFKQGKSYFGQEEKDWLKQLEKTKQKGIKILRVRIVSVPFSDYLKYEIDFWKNSIKSGEQIFFLLEEEYNIIKLNLNFKPEDFWMFDDNLIIFRYKSNGKWIGEELIEDELLIKKYKQLKEDLIKSSIPMEKFIKKFI